MDSKERMWRVPDNVIWFDVALAGLAALGYALIGLGLLGVGDLTNSERPSGIIAVAAGCYLLGGLLILARRRWLWITGAIINALVIVFFVLAYLHRPAVMFSAGGVATKTAQLLLEIGLIALIAGSWGRQRRQAAERLRVKS